MRNLLVAMGVAVMVLALVVAPVSADNGDTGGTARAVDYATVLLPLVLAATAVERILEMVFNWYENLVLKASKFVNIGGQYLKFAREQVERARAGIENVRSTITQVAEDEAFQNALATLKTQWRRRTNQPDAEVPDDVQAELKKEVTKKLLEDRIGKAEKELALAEQRLVDYLKSPLYASGKGAVAFCGGIVLGLVVALTSKIQMFDLLGIDKINNVVDMIVTGLIIGTGSAPVHALIGILQNTKSAVDEARALLKGKSIASVADLASELTTRAEGTLGEGAERNEVEYQRMISRVLR